MFQKIKYLAKKYNASSNVINNVNKLIDCKIKSNHLLNLALVSSEPITQPLETGQTELIVSFTTYNKRIHDVHLVIESIAQQTVKPNRMILWLDEDEFTLENIPLILNKQISRGLEVRFCPDYRSYKKLIPTIQAYPDSNVITIDDDILYPYDMIEILCKEHKQYPKCIIGHRAHKITQDLDFNILPYSQWEYETIENTQGDLIFITSGGGTFFPKNCFNDEVLNSDAFLSMCPNADDVWFKVMSLLNSAKCKKVNDARGFSERFLLLEHSQDIGLYNTNQKEAGNDNQIKTVFSYYDLYKKLSD
ncbi:glycosyl transferase [Aliivibrio fischeri]|uniref:glycosyl transferase n=1 Tax=Aliivibrio fischeri TaxID=668 RepID=UPI001F24B8D5|nr:glycosyl transferase [Aliivibrio fischeri]MCE7536796.1 glycosyl transferase [Aliivibrio fischeri]MCE7560488.1 glycosyl transferase [Aliivibrio fischeri]